MLTVYKDEEYVWNMTFEDVFREYYSYTVKQLIWIVKEQTVAEELAQDVFMQLYKMNWKEIENMRGWLFKSATFSAYNYFRSKNRQQSKIDKLIRFKDFDDVSSSEDQWLKKEKIETVHMILHYLPEQDRTLLLMKFSGFTYKEIATTLGIVPTSIGTLLVRAKKKFRVVYEKKIGGINNETL